MSRTRVMEDSTSTRGSEDLFKLVDLEAIHTAA